MPQDTHFRNTCTQFYGLLQYRNLKIVPEAQAVIIAFFWEGGGWIMLHTDEYFNVRKRRGSQGGRRESLSEQFCNLCSALIMTKVIKFGRMKCLWHASCTGGGEKRIDIAAREIRR
jgi:hypothetical protein